ncbi:hypothetical protein MTR_1g050442 [Medicago truncatula]|uniref:Uncharacterized protein n=1 Tax=Medicago truncatula TaxID=3880 RepID=A0A072VJ19_MEDTR|nr:hypothetical protein MTR_1g050442 [Medicago truncatula]
MHNAFSFEHKIIGNEEPNLSWAKVLLKVSSPEMVTEKFASSGPVTSSGASLEQMKLDQLVV